MINKDRLKNICADIGVELDAQALERFELFASMLVEKNKVLNLTAITDPEGIAVKHFADSLTALRMIDLQPGTKVIDVGTGGGFPGIPLMNILCEYCLPFVKVGGTFCAMKGAKGAEELDCAGKAIATLGGETQKTETLILPDGGERVLINVKKISHTATKYPRPSAQISKKPLV